MNSTLNKKDSIRRRFVLEENMWKVVLKISLPLAIYNVFTHLFSFLDTLMASHISSEVVSAVAYLSQIKTMITAVGSGLAVGGGIIIARYFGSGEIQKARKFVNNLMFLVISIGLVLLIGIIPFTRPILRLVKTPDELINVGTNYFIVEIVMIVLIFINNVYFAVEKAKGNTKIILNLNLLVIFIKIVLTAIFVYVLNFGVTMMAVATLISHLILTIIAMYNMLSIDNTFKLSIKDLDLSLEYIKPIIILALPIFVEKFTFSFGKVWVNSMSTYYGALVVGALGVSNNMGGIVTSLGNGFQEGGASIISQNIGNNNMERALDAFKKSLIINAINAGIGMLLMGIFMDNIINWFAKGDMVFAQEIKNIFKYEYYAFVTLAITASVMGLLYGLGYTKLSFVINFARLFVFRVPTLYILKEFTNLGSESVGIAMMVSNGMVGVLAIMISFFVIRKIKKTPYSIVKWV